MTEIRLCDKELCTGCMACYNACPHGSISINTDEEGFAVPVINHDTCLKCGKCMRVCPILKELKPVEVQTAFKGWSRDEELLKNSSSGGVFSLLSSQVLADGGIVYGAAFDENLYLRHVSAHTEEEMPKLRGSKYVQSYIGETFREIKEGLDEGKSVLFCGTPCQVAGLNGFLGKKDYPKLLTVDLVCHGVPSPKVFKSFKEWLENENNSQIEEYKFRDKKWSWMKYSSLVTFKNGAKHHGKWEEDPWMRGFLREYFLRQSCHHCKFANMNRQSDITLADFWSYYPKKGEVKNNDSGCSLILMNTEKGRNAFEPCKSQMHSYSITLDEARRCNQALNRCFPESPLRVEFWKDYNSKPFNDLIDKYMYPEDIARRYRVLYKYGRDAWQVKFFNIIKIIIIKIINFPSSLKNLIRR